MSTIKKAIPSFLTCCSLLSGSISITYAVIDKLDVAAIFIFIAVIFDFFDGFFARLLNAFSDFGKQLDSLSDVISFGLAPSIIIYRLILHTFVKMEPTSQYNVLSPDFPDIIILNASFLIVIFAALRLAKFNIDSSQKFLFKGLPTPATALFIASLGFIAEGESCEFLIELSTNLWFLSGSIVIFSYLMISNISMFSFKLKDLSLSKNIVKFVFLAISIILFIIFNFKSFIFIIPLYVLSSIIENLTIRKIE